MASESAAEGQSNIPHPRGYQIWHFSGFQYRHFLRIFKKAVKKWHNDKAPRLSAALAFYTVLSLAPLLVLIVAVAGAVYGREAAKGQLVWQIQDWVGPEGAKTIQALIQAAYEPTTGLTATSVGLLIMVFGAAAVAVELRDTLNTIWHVSADPGSAQFGGIIRLVKEWFYSFILVIGVGFLLLVSLLLNTCIAAMGRFFDPLLPLPEIVLQVGTSLMSFLLTTFLFAAIFKTLPYVHLKWREVILGASVTSLLFTIGKQLLGLYLGKTGLESMYGAAGSLVLVLVWVYYSGQVFFLGAEFTKVHTRFLRTHL